MDSRRPGLRWRQQVVVEGELHYKLSLVGVKSFTQGQSAGGTEKMNI